MLPSLLTESTFPWRLKARPNKNATGLGPVSRCPLPQLHSHSTSFPPSYLFSCFSLRTRTHPFSPSDEKKNNNNNAHNSSIPSLRMRTPLLLTSTFPSHSSLEEMWPRGLHEWSHFYCANNTKYTEAALRGTTFVYVGRQVRVSLHNGGTNWLFCSNNNISQWFSTPIWLITMPALAQRSHKLLWLVENHMRRGWASLV